MRRILVVFSTLFFLLAFKGFSENIPQPSLPSAGQINNQDSAPFQTYSKNNQENVNLASVDLGILTTDLDMPGRQLNLNIQRSYLSTLSEQITNFHPTTAFGEGWSLTVNGYEALYVKDYSEGLYKTVYLRQASGSVTKFVYQSISGNTVSYVRGDLNIDYETHRKWRIIDSSKSYLELNKSTMEFVYKTPAAVNYYFSHYSENRVDLTRIQDIYGNRILLNYDSQNKLARIQDSLDRFYMLNYNADGFLDNISCYQAGGSVYQRCRYVYSDSKLVKYVDAENRITSYQYEPGTIRINKVIYPSGGYTSYEYAEQEQIVNSDTYFNQGTLSGNDWEYMVKQNGSHQSKTTNEETGHWGIIKRIRADYSTSEKETTLYSKKNTYHYSTYLLYQGALTWDKDSDGNPFPIDIGSVIYKEHYHDMQSVENTTSVKDQNGYTTLYYYDAAGNNMKTVNPSYEDDHGNTFQEIVVNNYVLRSPVNAINESISLQHEWWVQKNYLDPTTWGDEFTIKYPKREAHDYPEVIWDKYEQIIFNNPNTVVTNICMFTPVSITNKIKLNNIESVISINKNFYDDQDNCVKMSNSLKSHVSYAEYDFQKNEFILNLLTEKWENNKDSGQLLKTEYKYNSFGNLSGVKQNIDGEMKTIASYEYDPDFPGNMLKMTDARGNVTLLEYSSQYKNGYVTKVKKYQDNLPITSSFSYDFYTGNVISIIDYNGNRSAYSYDKINRSVSTVSPDGTPKTIDYSTSLQNTVTLIKDKYGKILQKQIQYYSDLGKVLSSTVEDGQNSGIFNKILYLYDNRGQVTNVIQDPENKKIITRNYYDSLGRLRKTVFPDGGYKTFDSWYDVVNLLRIEEETSRPTLNTEDAQTIRKYFNLSGDLLKIEYPAVKLNGVDTVFTTEYEYDELGNQVSIKDANGNLKKMAYDEFGRVAKITYPDGSFTLNKYDLAGNLIKKTDPAGNITSFVFNEMNRTKSVTDSLGNITSFAYDPSGNKIRQTDPLGKASAFYYDVNGRLTRGVDPSGYSNCIAYDAMGNVIRQKDANGNVSIFEFDGLNRLIKSINALNQTSSFGYNNINQKLWIRDSKGATNRFYYDSMNRLIKTKDAAGKISIIEYDFFGNKKKVTDSENRWNTFQYDKLNRLVKTANAEYEVSYEYDALGNKIREIDGNGNTTTWQYDSQSRLTSTTDPKGFTMVYGYDQVDRLVSVQDKNGNRTYYAYDANGQKTQDKLPGGKIIKYAYNENGKLKIKTDEAGNVFRYYYDNRNLLTNFSTPEGTVKYQYDPSGNLMKVQDNNNIEKYYYDSLNRIAERRISFQGLSTNSPLTDGYSLKYQFDINGNVTGVKLPSGQVVNYQYDKLNRISKAALDIRTIASYSYDSTGKITSTVYGNNVKTTYAYNAIGQMNDQQVTGKSMSAGQIVQGLLLAEHYTYDKDGNRIEKTEQFTKKTRYGYDADNQLTGVDYDYKDVLKYDQTWEYDPMGNRTRLTYQYGTITYENDPQTCQLKQYAINKFGIVKYDYDIRGNTILKKSFTGNDFNRAFEYGYDPQNRLTKISFSNAKYHTCSEKNYWYNAAGLQIAVREMDETNKTAMTYYIYSGNDVLAEINAEGRIKSENIFGAGKICRVDYPLPVYADSYKKDVTASKIVYFSGDSVGSTLLLTDDKGLQIQRYEYDPFGAISLAYGKDGNKYTFAGKEFDDETGLSYFNARFYDPMTGRFLTRDPVDTTVDPDRSNPYVYCANNPYRYVDPDGEFFIGLGIGIDFSISMQGLRIGVGYGVGIGVASLSATVGISVGWSDHGFNMVGGYVSAGVQVGAFGANISANYDYNYKSGHSSYGAGASVGLMAGNRSVASLNADWNSDSGWDFGVSTGIPGLSISASMTFDNQGNPVFGAGANVMGIGVTKKFNGGSSWDWSVSGGMDNYSGKWKPSGILRINKYFREIRRAARPSSNPEESQFLGVYHTKKGVRGFTSDAAQWMFGYDDSDDYAAALFCSIDASKFEMNDMTMRMWKGNYGLFTGTEFGFYDSMGNSLTPSELSTYGIIETSISLYKKSDNSLILSHTQDGAYWNNGFVTGRLGKQNVFSQFNIGFETAEQATAFRGRLENTRNGAMQYFGNRNENISIGGAAGAKTVTIQWGK